MSSRRSHAPLTTPAQRRQLFEIWAATGNITLPCQAAHVGRRTFYYWKPRFDAAGYAGVEALASSAPKQPDRVDDIVATLPASLPKPMVWVPHVSANTVKSTLIDIGLWA